MYNINVFLILIGENCPIVETKLNELTKRFPELNANILGVVRDDKCDFHDRYVEVKLV